jgi:hypothetical protein
MSDTQKFLFAIVDLDQQRSGALDFLHQSDVKLILELHEAMIKALDPNKQADVIAGAIIDLGFKTYASDLMHKALEEEREENEMQQND